MDLKKKVIALGLALEFITFTLFLIAIAPGIEYQVPLIIWMFCVLIGGLIIYLVNEGDNNASN